MHVLPHISSYLIVYSICINFVFWFMAAPYGKFSIRQSKWMSPLAVENHIFRPLLTLGVFSFFIGWFENKNWDYHTDLPSSQKGWFLFIWLSIYFVWRTFIANFVCYILSSKEATGDKKVSLLVSIPYLFFYIPLGFYLRRVCAMIQDDIEAYEWVLVAFLIFFMLLNAYSDIKMNTRRNEEGKLYDYIGKYLSEKQLFEDFSSTHGMYRAVAFPPNYLFEIVHWLILSLFTVQWELFWTFCCIFIFLFVRAAWQKRWYQEPVQVVNQSLKQQETQENSVKNKITF